MNWLIPLIAVLAGGGGLAGLVTAFVAWKGSGTVKDDSRYNQLNELVKQYKEMVDEYRQEAGRDEARLSNVEKAAKELKKEHEQCQIELNAMRKSRKESDQKIHFLEARVAELGG